MTVTRTAITRAGPLRGGPARQRGVALITVLLVFALVAVIAAGMLHRGQLSLRGVANLLDTRQGYYYALAGETFARQILARDVTEGHGQVDTLSEAWAQTREQPPFPIDGGSIELEIRDLQGLFNLNSVIDAQGLPRPEGIEQFKRLLTVLQLDPNYADQWLDWVDRDQQRSANGAEDADYPDYRTAGHAEADISALRLLHSMQPQDYAKLAPHVTVLPVSDALVNVNTADASVLRALSPIINESRAAQIEARQRSGGYRDLAEFQALTGSSDLPIAVKSNFFEVVVTVNYAGRWQRIRTVLQREDNSGAVKFNVISRVRSPLIDDIEL